jgi:hypothetical protein
LCDCDCYYKCKSDRRFSFFQFQFQQKNVVVRLNYAISVAQGDQRKVDGLLRSLDLKRFEDGEEVANLSYIVRYRKLQKLVEQLRKLKVPLGDRRISFAAIVKQNERCRSNFAKLRKM